MICCLSKGIRSPASLDRGRLGTANDPGDPKNLPGPQHLGHILPMSFPAQPRSALPTMWVSSAPHWPWLCGPHTQSCSPLAWELPGGASLGSSLHALAGRGSHAQQMEATEMGRHHPSAPRTPGRGAHADQPVPVGLGCGPLLPGPLTLRYGVAPAWGVGLV